MENFNNADCLGFLSLLKMKHFLNQAFFFTESFVSTFFHLVPIWTLLQHKQRVRASTEGVSESMLLAQQTSLLPNCPPDPAVDHTGAHNKYDSVHDKNPPRPGAARRGGSKGPSLRSGGLMAARH